MAQSYQFTFIDAPIDTVWRVVFHDAETHGRIVTMQESSLLVVQSQDIFSIYGLRQYPAMEGKTGVYLVMTHDEAAASDLINAPDLFRALEALQGDVAPEIYEGAKAHLQNIKTLATEAAKRPPGDAYASKPSADPRKSGVDAQPVFGEGMPIVSLRLIWVVFILFILATFFILLFANGIFAAAALLALNWWSLGNPRKAVSTLVTSIGVWGIISFLIQMILLRLNLGRGSTLFLSLVIQIIVAAGVIFWQMRQQRPVYLQAVDRYGKPSGWALKNVGLTIAAMIIGGVIGEAWTEGFNTAASQVSAIVSSQQSYTDNGITFNYPAHWDATNIFDELCHTENAECLVTVGEPADASAFGAARNSNVFGFLVTLDSIVRLETNSLEAEADDRLVGEPTLSQSKIDGRDVFKYQYHYILAKGNTKMDMVGTFLFMRDDRDLIRMYMYTPVELVGTADAIMDSVRFLTPLDD